MGLRLGSPGNPSLRSYWRRRYHRRGRDVEAKRKAPAVVRLGGRRRKWRSWKTVVVRPVMRLARVKVPPPANAMARLRDAYTDAILQLSGVLAARCGVGMGTVWDRRIPRGREEGPKLGDFEKRHLLHLYNSVIATR